MMKIEEGHVVVVVNTTSLFSNLLGAYGVVTSVPNDYPKVWVKFNETIQGRHGGMEHSAVPSDLKVVGSLASGTNILDDYWVLMHPDGYLVRIAQKTDINYLTDARWKEALRFKTVEDADNLRVKMRDEKSTYDWEWLFWNDLKPRQIRVELF